MGAHERVYSSQASQCGTQKSSICNQQFQTMISYLTFIITFISEIWHKQMCHTMQIKWWQL